MRRFAVTGPFPARPPVRRWKSTTWTNWAWIDRIVPRCRHWCVRSAVDLWEYPHLPSPWGRTSLQWKKCASLTWCASACWRALPEAGSLLPPHGSTSDSPLRNRANRVRDGPNRESVPCSTETGAADACSFGDDWHTRKETPRTTRALSWLCWSHNGSLNGESWKAYCSRYC